MASTLTPTIITGASIDSSANVQDHDSADTNLTFTSGRTYIAGIASSDSAATENVPNSVGASDASLAFTAAATSTGFVSAGSPTHRISWWWAKPGSTLTGKTFRVSLDDAGTGCYAFLIEIPEATADTPIVAANVKSAVDTDTNVSATPDALGSTNNLQLALHEVAGETGAQTISGTDWSGLLNGTNDHALPDSRATVAVNSSGVAQTVTFTGNTFDRGLLVIEVAAADATGQPFGRRLGLSLNNRQHGIEGVRIF